MKFVYDEFSLSKQQSFFSEISLNSCLIGLDQLYTGRTGRSSRGSRGSMQGSGALKVLCSKTGSTHTGTCFSFSFCLVFFLVIAVLFCFFI